MTLPGKLHEAVFGRPPSRLGPIRKRLCALAMAINVAFSPAALADSSCTAHSSAQGTPRTCSITCESGKQAVCEEGMAGSNPVCRCADDAEAGDGEDAGEDAEVGK